jgi:hypothetical protein
MKSYEEGRMDKKRVRVEGMKESFWWKENTKQEKDD